MTAEPVVFEGFDVSTEAFRFHQASVATPVMRFHYRWKQYACTRKVWFESEAPREPDPAVVFRLGLAFAPQVFGCLNPHRFVVRAGLLPDAERTVWERWYTLALAEKCATHGLPVGTTVSCESDKAFPPLASRELTGSLLLNGGGKDTVAAAELLKEAGIPFRWLTIRENASRKAVRLASGTPDGISVRDGWQVPPPLKEYLYPGREAPTLLYYDFLGLLTAEMWGIKHVVTGNERSADVGNYLYQGIDVNHQYTKSHLFEADFAAYIRDFLASQVEFYSVLKPLHELQIAEVFSLFSQYHRAFVSCNWGQMAGRSEWCAKCSKCAFTFLSLFPFMPEDELLAIFGRNLLEDESLLPTFLELAGLEGTKPLECVGLAEETLAAAALASQSPLALREMRRRVPEERLRHCVELVMESYGREHLIPKALEPRIEEAYRRLRARRRGKNAATPALAGG